MYQILKKKQNTKNTPIAENIDKTPIGSLTTL